MKKQDVLNRVLNSESSIFSKDDVVRLIEMIEGGGRAITVSDIGRALESALTEISRNSDDVIDKDRAEFDINGNEIYISDIDFDMGFIRDTFEEYLMPLGEPDPEEEEVEPEFDSAGFSIADREEDPEQSHHCDDLDCNCM